MHLERMEPPRIIPHALRFRAYQEQNRHAFVIMIVLPIILAQATVPGSSDAPLRVLPVRTVSYGQAAVAAWLAVQVALLRYLCTVRSARVGSRVSVGAALLANLLSCLFLALSVVLPHTMTEQTRYAWEWYHAVRPLAPAVLLAIVGHRGRVHPYTHPDESDDAHFEWRFSFGFLLRELHPFARAVLVVVWALWVAVAAYLGAYDSIVFYFAIGLALQVGLAPAVALRTTERSVLPPVIGGGVELHTGFNGAELVARLATIDAQGVNFYAVPPVAMHGPALNSDPRMPMLSMRDQDEDSQRDESSDPAFKVEIYRATISSESARKARLRVARHFPHKHETNLQDTESISAIAEEFLKIEEENYGDEGESETLDFMDLILPEDACGVFTVLPAFTMVSLTCIGKMHTFLGAH